MSEEERPFAKLVRLQNGDDVVAEVVEIEDENGILYTLYHPLKAVYVPSDTIGYLSVAFIPWVFPRICDQEDFIIHAEDVLFVANVTEKMNEYYHESISSYMNRTVTEIDADEVEEEQPDESSILETLRDLAAKRTLH